MSGPIAKNRLVIEAEWEQCPIGSPEERATFAAIGIRCDDSWLTEAQDITVNRLRQKVYLSGYRLAEWLVCNWWRLRWEPAKTPPEESPPTDWNMAHRVATVGGGYIWPNLTIRSGGSYVSIKAEPTASRPSEPVRYIGQQDEVTIEASDFESAVDSFIEQVVGKLRAEKIEDSNLETVWKDVIEERTIPELARHRRLEALMGRDPDEADPEVIDRLIREAEDLGEWAIQELAAKCTGTKVPETITDIERMAQNWGVEASLRDVVHLTDQNDRITRPGDILAWKHGSNAALSLRIQERLGWDPISTQMLCQLSGVPAGPITEAKAAPWSFALDEIHSKSRVLLRSKWETGRRFDLARILGDRLTITTPGRLLPVTQVYTYRQRLQRSFAAEFLCPWEALADLLKKDRSPEAIEDAAAHFMVSERTVRAILVNHKLIDRNKLSEELSYQ